MTHPLAGMRVLDLTRLLPGAVCTMLLADLGAEIIKIEDPSGGDYARWMPPLIGGQSIFFRMNNRSKRSVILNLKDPRGAEVLKKLVASADVLVEGFRPGVMERLGVGYEALRAVNPRLVYCALSGWGKNGPYVERGGHDLNYVSLAGLTGAMDAPQPFGGQVADIGGALVGVGGILAALLRRERAGAGGFVDVALAEGALPFVLYAWAEALLLNTGSGAGNLTGGLACYRIYTTADGKSASLAALEPKFWANFCNAIERPDLLDNYLDAERQPYLRSELGGIFAGRTLDAWNALLLDADCCYAPVVAPGEVADDPHFAMRGMLGRFADGTPWMRSPIHLSDSEPQIENVIPGYGEHTREVLRAAGYSDAELDALTAAGVLK